MSKDTFLSFLKKNWPVLVLFLQAIVLFFTNYQPGTHLYGWDTTAPEHNLSLNLYRILTGVWQSYRGLGSVDGMAHTANSIHWIYVAILAQLVPLNMIRYILNIALHAIGGMGVYVLLKLLHKNHQNTTNFKLIALFSALVYQWNFMTIQMFYLPLELFSFHFAILPWGIWSAYHYLSCPSNKKLVVLFVINILGVSQAHVPSLFIVYSINILLLSLGLLIARKTTIKKVIKMTLTLFGANAFWGLGYIYSALRTSSTITSSTINQLSTPEIILRNNAWGDLYSVLTFGGFNLDYVDWESVKHYVPILGRWQSFYEFFPIQLLFLSISILAFLGLFIVVFKSFKKKNSILLIFTPAFLFFFSMVGTDIPGVGFVSYTFREFVPFFADIFRFTFTKFSFSYVFYISIFLSATLIFFESKIQQRYLKSTLLILLVFVFCVPIYSIAFSGWFFYPNLKQKIPEEYFGILTQINNEDLKRTLVLPMPTLYGWTNNSWGHRGSGFLWQLIPGAVVDRAFDAWSRENEQLYHQFNYAIETQDKEYFDSLLGYYQITHLIVDESIINPSEEENNIVVKKIENLIALSKYTQLEKQSDFLSLYSVESDFDHDLVFQPTLQEFTYFDPLIKNKDFTIKQDGVESAIIFRDLFNIQSIENFISESNSLVIPKQGGKKITFPALSDTTKLNPLVEVKQESGNVKISFIPLVKVVSGDSTQPVYQLEPIELKVPSSLKNPVLIFNDQLLRVDNNVVQQITDIIPSEIQYIALYDGDEISKEGDSYIITADPIQELYIEADYWEGLRKDIVMEASEGEYSYVIDLPKTENLLPILKGNPVINCAENGEGEITKIQNDENISYSANNKSAACEGFYLPTSATDNTTILSIIGENISGRNLKVFLRDDNQRVNRLEYLFQDSSYHVSFLIPPYETQESLQASSSAYWLNFETRSFGRETSKNLVNSTTAQILPIDFELLKLIVDEDLVKPDISLCSIDSQNFVLYSYLRQDGDNCYYTNSQSYDPAWVAFIAPESPLGYFNPQTYSFLPHTRLNSWANAWEVPSGEHDIVIVFWPQLLTFMGYGFLGITVITLLFQVAKERKTPLSKVQKVQKDMMVSQNKAEVSSTKETKLFSLEKKEVSSENTVRVPENITVKKPQSTEHDARQAGQITHAAASTAFENAQFARDEKDKTFVDLDKKNLSDNQVTENKNQEQQGSKESQTPDQDKIKENENFDVQEAEHSSPQIVGSGKSIEEDQSPAHRELEKIQLDIEKTLVAERDNPRYQPHKVKRIPQLEKNSSRQKISKINHLILERLYGRI